MSQLTLFTSQHSSRHERRKWERAYAPQEEDEDPFEADDEDPLEEEDEDPSADEDPFPFSDSFPLFFPPGFGTLFPSGPISNEVGCSGLSGLGPGGARVRRAPVALN